MFDVKVSAQKRNAYSRLSQNELAMELYRMGIFDEGKEQEALRRLRMMEFDGRDELIGRITASMGSREKLDELQKYKALALAFARRYRPDMAEGLGVAVDPSLGASSEAAAAPLGAPSEAAAAPLGAPSRELSRQRLRGRQMRDWSRVKKTPTPPPSPLCSHRRTSRDARRVFPGRAPPAPDRPRRWGSAAPTRLRGAEHSGVRAAGRGRGGRSVTRRGGATPAGGGRIARAASACWPRELPGVREL